MYLVPQKVIKTEALLHVYLDLNPGYNKFYGRYYYVPRSNKETFHKYMMRLLDIGLVNLVQQSKYSTPSFIINNKEYTVRFIIYFRKINQQLVRKTQYIPRIGEKTQQL